MEMEMGYLVLRAANRVGGGIAPPASHTTGHAGPRPAIPGSPPGLSSNSFSATMIGPVAQPIGFSAPGLDQRWSCLPAKFSPSRVVSPSGLFVSGSLLSVLRPRLTAVPARPPLLAASPALADR